MNEYEIDLALARIAYPNLVVLNPMGFSNEYLEAQWWVVDETNPNKHIYWLIGKDYSPTKYWNQAEKFLDGNLSFIQKALNIKTTTDVKSLLIESVRIYVTERITK